MNQRQQEQLWSADLTPTVRSIAFSALDKIDQDYSRSGDVRNNASADQYRPYHNGQHTRNALVDFRKLRDTLGLTAFEYNLGITAMSSHDIFCEIGADRSNEIDSANWLVNQLKSSPEEFTEFQIETGRLAILGTRWTKNKSGYLEQFATKQVYPSKRAELIALAVAGSDLGRVYTPEGPLLAHQLFQEISTGSSGKVPNIEELADFQREQTSHFFDYPSPEIKNTLASHFSEVMRYNEQILKDLEAGNIKNWEDLINRDKGFMAEHS